MAGKKPASFSERWKQLDEPHARNTYNSVYVVWLFAPNCVFNNASYSDFNNDPADYAAFYSAERHMFAGADRNPAIEDASGFKGYANWIPASSTIMSMPFETNFNTGHGLKKFEDGVETSSAPWHNMDDQDILPNWQFAFSENSQLSATWDFDNAWNGGSALLVNGTLEANTPVDLVLYKTKITSLRTPFWMWCLITNSPMITFYM